VSALKQYLAQCDASGLGRIAHKLGGTSASLGARGVADVCNRMERHAIDGDLQTLPALVDELEMSFARTRAAFQKFA
jgi:HPt (histidine-containing phosphotransfer) domain-containing protein